MADPSPDTGDAAGPGGSDGMPRWVKVFVIAGIALALLVAVVLLLGPGGHGPQRHLPGADTSEVESPPGHTPPTGVPGHG